MSGRAICPRCGRPRATKEQINKWRYGTPRISFGACWAPPIATEGQIWARLESASIEALRSALRGIRTIEGFENGTDDAGPDSFLLSGEERALDCDGVKRLICETQARLDLIDCKRAKRGAG